MSSTCPQLILNLFSRFSRSKTRNYGPSQDHVPDQIALQTYMYMDGETTCAMLGSRNVAGNSNYLAADTVTDAPRPKVAPYDSEVYSLRG